MTDFSVGDIVAVKGTSKSVNWRGYEAQVRHVSADEHDVLLSVLDGSERPDGSTYKTFYWGKDDLTLVKSAQRYTYDVGQTVVISSVPGLDRNRYLAGERAVITNSSPTGDQSAFRARMEKDGSEWWVYVDHEATAALAAKPAKREFKEGDRVVIVGPHLLEYSIREFNEGLDLYKVVTVAESFVHLDDSPNVRVRQDSGRTSAISKESVQHLDEFLAEVAKDEKVAAALRIGADQLLAEINTLETAMEGILKALAVFKQKVESN